MVSVQIQIRISLDTSLWRHILIAALPTLPSVDPCSIDS